MGLTPRGRAAFARAAARLEELFGDGAAQYYAAASRDAHAVDAAVRARTEWDKAGRPFVHEHVNHALGPHPLARAVIEAARYEAAVLLDPPSAAARRPGRPQGMASAPDRRPGEPPRLTMVSQ